MVGRYYHIVFICLALFVSFTTAKVAPKIQGSWNRLPNYPRRVFEAAGGVIRTSDGGYELIIAGGYLSNSGLRTTKEMYSLRLDSNKYTGKWERRPDMPADLTHCSQVLVGSEMFICGGFLGRAPGRSVTNCYVYKRKEDKWANIPFLPEDRGGGGLVLLANGHLLYSSGMVRKEGFWGGVDIGTTWSLSLRNPGQGWIRKASISNPRNHMAAIESRGKYFFLGGQHSGNENTGNQNTVQEYDFINNKWYTKKSIPNPVGHIAASTIKYWNGVIVVAGIENGRKVSNKVWFYDTVYDDWHRIGSFPRSIQSPVCGRMGLTLVCATGLGHPGLANEVYSVTLSEPMNV